MSVTFRFVCIFVFVCILGEGGVHFSACFIDTKNNNKYMSVLIFTTFRSKGVQLFLFFRVFSSLLYNKFLCWCVCINRLQLASSLFPPRPETEKKTTSTV